MRFRSGVAASILVLVACSAMPLPQEEQVILPVIVVEEKKEEPKLPPPKAKPDPKTAKAKPENRKSDKICPPIEGETDNQRIIRKLDCLIEREPD